MEHTDFRDQVTVTALLEAGSGVLLFVKKSIIGSVLLRDRHADAGATEAVELVNFVIRGLQSAFRGAVGDDHQTGNTRFVSHIFGFVLANTADRDSMASKDMSDVSEDSGTIRDCEAEIVSAGEFFARLELKRSALTHAAHGLEVKFGTSGGAVDKVGEDRRGGWKLSGSGASQPEYAE